MGRPADPRHPQACPVLALEHHPDAVRALRDAPDYKRGVLPQGKGLLDEGVKWLELVRLVEAEAGVFARELAKSKSKDPQ